MKLWIDNTQPAPDGYIWCKDIYCAIDEIKAFENKKEELLDEWDFPPIEIWNMTIETIDIINHIKVNECIKFLTWLEKTGRNYPIHIHSMNPVGVANMRTIIQRNGWKEV